MDNSGVASVKKWLVNNFSSPDRAPTCWRRVVAGRFHFGGASRPQLRWSTTASVWSWVGDSVTAARGTLSKTTRALKGTDGQHDSAIAFLKRVLGSRSTAGRVPTPQNLSVTKQHRNGRWDLCTASAGDWPIIMTASHRSANQRYFMHNSATVHRMRMQSTALDSSRSQLCNDTSTGVRHQITKWRRLQKVVRYDVLQTCDQARRPCDHAFMLLGNKHHVTEFHSQDSWLTGQGLDSLEGGGHDHGHGQEPQPRIFIRIKFETPSTLEQQVLTWPQLSTFYSCFWHHFGQSVCFWCFD